MSNHTPFDAPRFAPLVMTALFDERSFALFDDLRCRHFPPGLNRVPAHATLFHHLDGREIGTVAATMAEACKRTGPLLFSADRTRFLGGGVALAIDSARLVALRSALASAWRDHLTAQDRQPYRPHVTVQNKVAPQTARRTQATLDAVLPIVGTIEGLTLWHYRGGPWEHAGDYRFLD